MLCFLAYLTVIAIACRLHPRRPAGYQRLLTLNDEVPEVSDQSMFHPTRQT